MPLSFVKDSVNFNENLASFIGDLGAAEFLRDTYGEDSEELKAYLTEVHEEREYAAHILKGADLLTQLYLESEGRDSIQIAADKNDLIKKLYRIWIPFRSPK